MAKKNIKSSGRVKPLSRLIAAGVALVVALLFLSLRGSEYISEYVFSRGISRYWITAAGTICGIFPFSVFEIAAGLVIFYCIYCIIKALVRLISRKGSVLVPVSKLLLTVTIIAAIYTGTAAFAYSRDDLINHIPNYESTLTDEEAMEVVLKATEEMNALAEKFETAEDGTLVCPYTNEELESLVRSEYDRLTDDYFTPYTAELKPLITGDIFSLFGIIGISFQPTGEANYNINTDATDMAQTMMHELAHNKGIMTESDANLLSVYLCLTSENDYIRYSGYHNCYSQIVNILTLHNPNIDVTEIYKLLSPTVRSHINAASAHYRSYRSFVTDIGTFINDVYLKINGASNGTGSYYVSGTVSSAVITDESGNKVVVNNINYSPMQRMCIEVLI